MSNIILVADKHGNPVGGREISAILGYNKPAQTTNAEPESSDLQRLMLLSNHPVNRGIRCLSNIDMPKVDGTLIGGNMKICQQCGKPYSGEGDVFCSRACLHESMKRRVQRICQQCRKEFEVTKKRKDTAFYCCRSCYFEARRAGIVQVEKRYGKPISEILRTLYVEQELSTVAISRKTGLTLPYVLRALSDFGIQARSLPDAHRIRVNLLAPAQRREMVRPAIETQKRLWNTDPAWAQKMRKIRRASTLRAIREGRLVMPDNRIAPELRRQRQQAWRQSYDKARRAAPGDYETEREKALRRDNYTCRVCNTKDADQGGRGLCTHHKIPVLAGGTNYASNLVTLCNACHRKVEVDTAEVPCEQ